MNALEWRATAVLSGLYGLRMLGLFMILPVFSLYAPQLTAYTPVLMGITIGAYGLTQALLQIPLGIASDRIGRRPVIVAGLLLFALGSVVAALSDSIYGVLLGRVLQGAGAISAALLALAADMTREEQRTQAMGVIGLAIGASFALALVLGPLLNQWVGVPGIFWLTAALAVGGIAALRTLPPSPQCQHREVQPVAALLGGVLRDRELLRLNWGVGLLHLVMTATFVALPLVLRDRVHLPVGQHGALYLPVLLLSLGLAVPLIIGAERYRRMKSIFLLAIGLLGAALGGIYLLLGATQVPVYAAGALLTVYFVGVNVLEASLPSLVSKQAAPDSKGTAMGLYATFQFLGAFLGGVLGGFLLQHGGEAQVFMALPLVVMAWMLIAAGMQAPRAVSSYLLRVGLIGEAEAAQLALRLRGVRGVEQAVVVGAEGVAYLKVDRRVLDRAALQAFQAA